MKIDEMLILDTLHKSSKICVFGCSGSGKSTFSKSLSKTLNIPVIHLDKIYWKPEWVSISKDEFDEELAKVVAKEKWIIEGNYNRTLDYRLDNCDFAIYLDMNKFVCLSGAIKRYFKYKNKTRDDITKGCNETIDKEFIKYIWNFNKNHRKAYYEKLKYLNKPYLVIKNRKKFKYIINYLKNNF